MMHYGLFWKPVFYGLLWNNCMPWKVSFSIYIPKHNQSIKLQDFLNLNVLKAVWSITLVICMHVNIHENDLQNNQQNDVIFEMNFGQMGLTFFEILATNQIAGFMKLVYLWNLKGYDLDLLHLVRYSQEQQINMVV